MDNLSYNYVLSGYRQQTPIIVKLNCDALSLNREAHALEAFAGYGAVALLDRQQNALLLQRALPGRCLKNNPKAIEIACAVIEKLHKAPVPKDHPFPHIKDWLSALDKDWKLPQAYIKMAREYKNQLLKTSAPCILLHGDLHQDNILANEEDWLVIDPKGVIGYPIKDVCACVENPDYDLKYIAHYFHYPLEEVTQWYFVHLLLAACWQVEDKLDPSRFLDLAKPIFLKENDRR